MLSRLGSLAPERCANNFKSIIAKISSLGIHREIALLCWLIDIGSGNILVPQKNVRGESCFWQVLIARCTTLWHVVLRGVTSYFTLYYETRLIEYNLLHIGIHVIENRRKWA